jgi:hypothetical protein
MDQYDQPNWSENLEAKQDDEADANRPLFVAKYSGNSHQGDEG